jgi:hypothetical protein
MEVSVIGWSPLRNYYVEQHTQTANEVMRVWLVSARNPKRRQLLYTHSRSVEVLISEDEHWLVINDHAGSNIASVLLFRQWHGLGYEQVEDLTDKAWEYLAARCGRAKRPALDHSYAEVLRWTDNHTLLLCLHGHLDDRNYVQDWLCLYDVKAQAFSTDLDRHNRQHTTLESKW